MQYVGIWPLFLNHNFYKKNDNFTIKLCIVFNKYPVLEIMF